MKMIIGYQTTENKYTTLDCPIKCRREDAWLGCGYYFWEREEFAKDWGHDGYKGREFDIYTAKLNITKSIDAEYSREGREFFEYAIAKVIEQFNAQGKRLDLRAIHNMLAEQFWKPNGVTGIIYGDTPKREKYKIGELVYIKRVQIVMFHTNTITNYELFKD